MYDDGGTTEEVKTAQPLGIHIDVGISLIAFASRSYPSSKKGEDIASVFCGQSPFVYRRRCTCSAKAELDGVNTRAWGALWAIRRFSGTEDDRVLIVTGQAEQREGAVTTSQEWLS